MPGSITLPQIVLDLEEEDRKKYEALKPPSSIVVRYGYMKMVAELPYDGEAKPGCGSKLVIRSSRGIELGEMLTTTCGNGGCGKSVSRKEMLEYIENSGGRDYPFTTQGKVLRVATTEDLADQAKLDSHKMPMIRFAKQVIGELDLPMKLVDVEMLLGGERIIFHYASENWIDFRELVRRLAAEYQTRIEMHQVNARDEARLVADYEKCGQHCCCKQFLKVLKPVSMRSAKVQKATLDPTKISGRCGRLMCCLRYEDETYESLRRNLPNRQSRVLTADGVGTVIDSQILTQLVLVRLDTAPAAAAYPLESIELLAKTDPRFRPPPPPVDDRRPGPDRAPPPRRPQPGAPLRANEVEAREGAPLTPVEEPPAAPEVHDVSESHDGSSDLADDHAVEPPALDQPIHNAGQAETRGPSGPPGNPGQASDQSPDGRRRRRRRRRGRGRGQNRGDGGPPSSGGPPGP